MVVHEVKHEPRVTGVRG